MLRKGAINPEELIDDNYKLTDEIVMTICQCCEKPFYVLKRDLYIENVVKDENEPQIDDHFQLKYFPKCPHCGFCASLSCCSTTTNK